MLFSQPRLITGNSHTDARGILRFANDFRMDDVKRFYKVHHLDTKVVRAWQAHAVDQKWMHVLEGKFIIALVAPDDWQKPSRVLPVITYELNAADNNILHIPAGYANGFKALVPDSKMIVYTDSTIEEAQNDDVRFPSGYWFDWNALQPYTDKNFENA